MVLKWIAMGVVFAGCSAVTVQPFDTDFGGGSDAGLPTGSSDEALVVAWGQRFPNDFQLRRKYLIALPALGPELHKANATGTSLTLQIPLSPEQSTSVLGSTTDVLIIEDVDDDGSCSLGDILSRVVGDVIVGSETSAFVNFDYAPGQPVVDECSLP